MHLSTKVIKKGLSNTVDIYTETKEIHTHAHTCVYWTPLRGSPMS